MIRKISAALALTLATVAAAPSPAAAARSRFSAAESALCTRWFAEAERTYGLPNGLLMAVSLTESGIGLDDGGKGPWPWTINIQGKDHRPATREEALAIVANAAPNASLDLGCMQVNRRWHWQDFPGRDPAYVIEPRNNVFWAAWWLRTLHDKYGSWTEATGKYHSFVEDRAQGYRERVAGNALGTR